MALSELSLQHADDFYSGRENLRGVVLHTTLIIYSPDGTSVYGSRAAEF